MYNSDRYLRRKYTAAQSSTGVDGAENGDGTPAYAMAYVRDQQYGQIYSDTEALGHGTLFPALYMPLEGGRR
ncbi:MAG: spore coat associated protein CotJA [Clostridia bacterium]|nr:spore coat associated protein CotJA [Clostridia bacterium]